MLESHCCDKKKKKKLPQKHPGLLGGKNSDCEKLWKQSFRGNVGEQHTIHYIGISGF